MGVELVACSTVTDRSRNIICRINMKKNENIMTTVIDLLHVPQARERRIQVDRDFLELWEDSRIDHLDCCAIERR